MKLFKLIFEKHFFWCKNHGGALKVRLLKKLHLFVYFLFMGNFK